MEEAILEIPVDGRWSLDDLDDFAEALRLCYAYYYATSEQTRKDEQRIAFLMQRYFWAGTHQGDDFAAKLYSAIPDEGQPFVRRFEYASPGIIEIGTSAAAGPALWALSHGVRSWVRTLREAFQLYKDVDEFFTKRRLARIPKKFALDTLTPGDIERAKELCLEMGQRLGMDHSTVEALLVKTGNPIFELKLLVQMATQTARRGELESKGKAKMSRARVDAAEEAEEAGDIEAGAPVAAGRPCCPSWTPYPAMTSGPAGLPMPPAMTGRERAGREAPRRSRWGHASGKESPPGWCHRTARGSEGPQC